MVRPTRLDCRLHAVAAWRPKIGVFLCRLLSRDPDADPTAQAGDLTRYISESVILGFMLGAGVLVALSQCRRCWAWPAEGEGHQHFLTASG